MKFSAARGDSSLFKSHMRSIVRDFSAIRQAHAPLPRVGIVGEILLKYHPDANNQVIRHIMEEGGEPVLTDLMDFFLYCLLDPVYLWRHMGGKAFPAFSNWLLIKRIESLRDAMRRALEGSRFLPVPGLRIWPAACAASFPRAIRPGKAGCSRRKCWNSSTTGGQRPVPPAVRLPAQPHYGQGVLKN
ncbi:MAG: hypothetical protein ACLRWP_05325 [Bilophila wadsworthia]